MYILKFGLFFMFLLLYVKFNSAFDCNVHCSAYLKNETDPMLRNLTEYATKFEQQERLIKNLKAKKREKETIITTLESTCITAKTFDKFVTNIFKELRAQTHELKEQLSQEISKLQATKINAQNSTITKLNTEQQLAHSTLLTEKNDLKIERPIDPTEATSCLAFGNSNGVQTIRVPGIDAFQVCCESKIAGDGWTVIQRKIYNDEQFYRTWEEYKQGFGYPEINHWLGLEKLHLMTKYQQHELYIYMLHKNRTRFARYSNFSIGSEAQSYEILTLGEFTGNAGNSLSQHKNMKFSTPDRDNDKVDKINCAGAHASGWWFNKCRLCNLNQFEWNVLFDPPLTYVQMMIRPKIKLK